MVYLQQELDIAHRVARRRVLEDLQTREYTDRLHLHNHTLLQKINFLTDSNCQKRHLTLDIETETVWNGYECAGGVSDPQKPFNHSFDEGHCQRLVGPTMTI